MRIVTIVSTCGAGAAAATAETPRPAVASATTKTAAASAEGADSVRAVLFALWKPNPPRAGGKNGTATRYDTTAALAAAPADASGDTRTAPGARPKNAASPTRRYAALCAFHADGASGLSANEPATA